MNVKVRNDSFYTIRCMALSAMKTRRFEGKMMELV